MPGIGDSSSEITDGLFLGPAIQAARAAVERGLFPGGVLFADMCGYDPDRRLSPGAAPEGFLRAVGVPGPRSSRRTEHGPARGGSGDLP